MISETNEPTTGTKLTFLEISVRIAKKIASPTVAPNAHASPPAKLLTSISHHASLVMAFSYGWYVFLRAGIVHFKCTVNLFFLQAFLYAFHDFVSYLAVERHHALVIHESRSISQA